jgi:hypothetical protein
MSRTVPTTPRPPPVPHLERRSMTRGRNTVWLIGVTLFGLVSAACVRVQSHLELPELAAEDPSFLPTLIAF